MTNKCKTTNVSSVLNEIWISMLAKQKKKRENQCREFRFKPGPHKITRTNYDGLKQRDSAG